ncbi:MAG: hypothetical protein WA949_04215, partial [Phormidesmis sp.]
RCFNQKRDAPYRATIGAPSHLAKVGYSHSSCLDGILFVGNYLIYREWPDLKQDFVEFESFTEFVEQAFQDAKKGDSVAVSLES